MPNSGGLVGNGFYVMKKILFSCLIALISSVTALAYDYMVDDIYYNITGTNTVEVTYKDTNYDSYWDYNITIPSTITRGSKTYRVTAIGEYAFRGSSHYISLTLPEGLTTIGTGAFYESYYMSLPNLPSSLTTIGNLAFYGASIANVNIPDNVTSIGDMAFANISYGLTITLGNGVTKIPDMAFYQTKFSDGYFIIPNSVTEIGASAFQETDLSEIYFGAKVSRVGQMAFAGCSNLKRIFCKSTVPPTLPDNPNAPGGFESSIYSTANLWVPDGAVNAYRAANYWRNFSSVGVGFRTEFCGDVDGNGHVTISDVTRLINMLLSGSPIVNGLTDVNGDGSVNINDVTRLINQLLSGDFGPQTFYLMGVPFTMIPVQGGTFTMGATEEQGTDATNYEKPAHQVTLSSYSIGQTELTCEQWLLLMDSNDIDSYSDIKEPAMVASYLDIAPYLAKLSAITDLHFKLPTEAQWEFAARGGNKSLGFKYAGSDDVNAVAWYYGNSSNDYTYYPVASKRPNELGLYDMSGNAAEWCEDWAMSYPSTPQIDPVSPVEDPSPTHSESRILRGGSVKTDAIKCRVSARDYFVQHAYLNYGSFRLVR